MSYFFRNKVWLSFLVFVVAFVISCGGDDDGGVTPNNCATPPSLSLTVSKQPACSATDGIIEATASGGNGGFTYSKDGVSFQTSNVFNNLTAGNYEITVKDLKGCTTKKSITITSVGSNLSLSLEVSKKPDCGTANGTVTVTANGGTGTLTYSKDGISFQASNVFDNLAASNYEITVKDANGCTSKQNINVSANISLTTDIVPIINTNCALSGCHGSGQTGRPDFTKKENIISSAASIKERTNSGTMPPIWKII
ncbi:MAG: hypothetical protein OHK0038_02080 [Flammeovirgaceae bacterium]